MKTKLKWYYLLLVFAVVGVVTTAIIRILTPPITTIPTTPFTSTSVGGVSIQFKNIQYVGETPSFPSSLPVGVIQPSSNTPDILLDSLVAKYAMARHPKLNFIWLGQGTSLNYDASANVATWSLELNDPNEEHHTTTPFPTEEAKIKASSFLQETLPFLNGVSLQESKISFFEGDHYLAGSTEQNAMYVNLPYTWTIESIPIFVDSAISYPVELLISRDLIITKAIISLQQFTYTLTPKQSLISISEAITNLNTTQNGILLGFATSEGSINSFEEITSGELKTVSLEYRLDPNSNLLYPFYHFKGEVHTPTGSSQVDIATPAIKTTEPRQ